MFHSSSHFASISILTNLKAESDVIQKFYLADSQDFTLDPFGRVWNQSIPRRKSELTLIVDGNFADVCNLRIGRKCMVWIMKCWKLFKINDIYDRIWRLTCSLVIKRRNNGFQKSIPWTKSNSCPAKAPSVRYCVEIEILRPAIRVRCLFFIDCIVSEAANNLICTGQNLSIPRVFTLCIDIDIIN